MKATPLKRKNHSEKKSSPKKKVKIIEEVKEKPEKKNLLGKKRNIVFTDERTVKEYNPKTPVRDVKHRDIRKSPLVRRKK